MTHGWPGSASLRAFGQDNMDTNKLGAVLSLPQSRGLSVDIAARLRDAILGGHFQPGAQLREAHLAQFLGVSRGPVREALFRLEREGIVVIRRNRGAFVAQLSRQDLDEVYTLRVVLERFALERTVEFAGETLIKDFLETVEAMQAATSQEVTEQEAAELDLRFHDLIYQGSNHRRLLDSWGNLRPQIHVLLLNRNVAHRDFREQLVASHRALLNAIVDGDRERALVLLDEHLHGSYQRVSAMHAADGGAATGSGDASTNERQG
jgi:DNA-binding GntR family transcriptional regulator